MAAMMTRFLDVFIHSPYGLILLSVILILGFLRLLVWIFRLILVTVVFFTADYAYLIYQQYQQSPKEFMGKIATSIFGGAAALIGLIAFIIFILSFRKKSAPETQKNHQ
jgi:hypothetical protein